MNFSAWTALVLVAVGIGLAAWRRPALRGTTLTAPWSWLLAALAAVAGAEFVEELFDPSEGLVTSLRFTAAATTFCPLMALLGAKRPQDRAWHFVVFSLLIVLILPAVESLVLRPGQPLDIRGARAWFLLILILVGLVNSLPTRFWLAVLLYSGGQMVLLAPFLPLPSDWIPTFGIDRLLLGLGLLVAAVAAAVGVAALPRRRLQARHPLDRLWHDFRDSFGVFWGLRVMERVNAAAQMYDWNIRLTWSGFVAEDNRPLAEAMSPEVRRVLHQNLKNLLRRFVSHDWIARRLGDPLD